MQRLDLPVYRPGADLSILGMKGLIPGFNLASSYNKAIKIFNDLPFSRNGLYQEMDLLVYLNNSEKGKKFRDFLLTNLKGDINENLLNIKKRNFTVIDIIKSLKNKSNKEVNLFILREYSYYLSKEIHNYAEIIYNYFEDKLSKKTLNDEENNILEKYYSAAIEMTEVLLGVEILKVNVELGLDLKSIIENVEEQVELIIN